MNTNNKTKKRVYFPPKRADVFEDKRTKRTRTRSAQRKKYISENSDE